MSGGGTRLTLGLALGACLLALLAYDGQKGPADAQPPETCGVKAPWVCVNGVPWCPATSVCPTEVAGTPDPSTTAPLPAIVTVPNTDTTGPATTTAKPRPDSEAEAKPADAPVEAPATDPPATVPATQAPATAPPQTATTAPRPSHGACSQTVTVAAGESWSLLARRYGVSAVSLAGANNTTVDGALWPNDVLCLPGGASSATTTTSSTTTTTTTVAPTTAPRSAERSTTTTTNPRQRRTTTTTTAAPKPTTTVAKVGQDVPKQPQAPPVIVATTTTVQCAVC